MLRFSKQSLFASASAVALAFMAQGAAADGTSQNLWVSVEGQYAMWHGNAVNLDLYGENLNLSPDNGWTGAIKAGSKVYGDWFVEGGLRYGKSGKDSIGYYYSPDAFANASYDEDHLVLDFQVGREIGIGGGSSVRVYGGLRYASFNGDTNAYGYYYEDTVSLSAKHKFNGIGPRVGFDAMIPVADGLSFDIGGSAAALYGKRKFSGTISYNGEPVSGSDSDNHFVPNVEGSVAITYKFSQFASVSTGYRASQYWNVVPEFDNSGISYANRLIHGPFLTLTFTN